MKMVLKLCACKVFAVRLILILPLTANCSIDNKHPDNIAPTNCLPDITVHKKIIENEDTDTTEEEDILEEGITLIFDALTTNKRLASAYSNSKGQKWKIEEQQERNTKSRRDKEKKPPCLVNQTQKRMNIL